MKLHLQRAGATHHSAEAVINIKAFCENYLAGRYSLGIVDVYQQPALAEMHQIIAAPTLIISTHGFVRRIIGDLSNTEKILLTLE